VVLMVRSRSSHIPTGFIMVRVDEGIGDNHGGTRLHRFD
jgi:hypothetical protein